MKKIFFAIAVGLLLSATLSSADRQRQAAKLDEFGDVCCNDEKARLDNFTNQLQNEPDAIGYIIFYGGLRQQYPSCGTARLRLPRRGDGEARAARLKPYLVDSRGLEPERIVVINGGYREIWTAELWIVPQGAAAPTATPTVKPEKLKFRRGKVRQRDYECNV